MSDSMCINLPLKQTVQFVFEDSEVFFPIPFPLVFY
jgi:hypothetical protein